MHFLRFQKEFGDVPGYTQPESMCIWDFLLEFQSQTWQPASFLEIGVYYGQSAMMLALHCKNDETVLLIDPSEYVEEARKLLSGFAAAKFEIIKARSSDGQSWALTSRYTHSGTTWLAGYPPEGSRTLRSSRPTIRTSSMHLES